MKYNRLFQPSRLAAAITALLATQGAQATSSSWSSTSDGNWATAGNWTDGVPGAVSPFASDDVATFGNTLSGPVAVTVDSGRTIKGITFSNTSTNGFSLSSGSLLLTSGATIETLSANGVHSDTISSPIQIKGNAGTAAFTANATATGSVLVIGGAVTGESTAGNTTVLTLGGSNTGATKISGAISDGTNGGKLAITKSGAGTWALDGSNSQSGNTTVSGGRLIAANSSALGTGAATVASSANLFLYTLGSALFANAITLNGPGTGVEGALESSSTGTNELTGLISLSGNSRINSDAGTFNISNPGKIEGTIGNTGTNLTLGGTANTEVRSIIETGAGTLTKDGSGTVTLYSNSTYTGATSVSLGVLNVRANTALGTNGGGVTVTAGAALELQENIVIGAEALNIGGTGVGSAGALRNVSGTNIYGGLLTLSEATRINSDLGLLTLSNTGTITGATYGLTVGGVNSTTINSIIGTTTGGLNKDGAGTLTLTGVNTYTGATTLTGGILSVGTIGNGGVAGNLGKASTAAGKLLFDGGTLQYTGATSSTNRAFTINADKIARIDVTTSASNLTFSSSGGAPDVNSGLTKLGLGTLTFSGTNIHEGPTTVSAGTLNVTGSFATGGAESVVTVGGNGSTGTPRLAGSGTLIAPSITGPTTIAAAGTGVVGIHSPGGRDTNGTASLLGTQFFGSTLAYGTGSIFEWQLNATTTDPGADTINSGTRDKVVVESNITGGGAVFNVALGTNGYTDAFWNTNKTWDDIFTSTSGTFNLSTLFTSYSGTSLNTDGTVTGQGYFTMGSPSTSTLYWTAVPEPTSALAGLLLGAGLLRRRRKLA